MKTFQASLLSAAVVIVLIILSLEIFTASLFTKDTESRKEKINDVDHNATASLTPAEKEKLIYGKELITHTALYLGPRGSVAHVSNGMNCQNCHVNGGEQLYGNSFFAVSSTYPKFRPRSGKVESIEFRVNDCLERSLNGKTIDDSSREMEAMVAYIKEVGIDAVKDGKIKAAGTEDLGFLNRAADPSKGKAIYLSKCMVCHGKNGEGLGSGDANGYIYPPLWGENSYNISAGIYRLSRLAGFIRNNMPFGTTYKNPQLSTKEAWDVASFINSQPRTKKLFSFDWPDIKSKPIDYPFGPYSDGYTELQHKYGPFKEMMVARNTSRKK